MDYRLARILRYIIFFIVGLLCLLILYFGFKGIQHVLKPSASKEAAKAVNLYDYQNNGAQIRYIITGPVVANQNFRKIVISVSATQAVVEVTIGYDQAPVLSQAFANNQVAYDTFIAALNVAGYTNIKTAPSGANRQGSCSVSDKFSYQIFANNNYAQDSWNTACDPNQGTFAGQSSLTQQLFQAQIPNYSQIVSTVPQGQ